MCRIRKCLFGVGNWIFLLAVSLLFTSSQGGDELKQKYEVLRFTVEPSDAVVGAGGSVTLPCSASPSASLAWRYSKLAMPHRDHTLTNADTHRRQLANGSLAISGMSLELAGQYQCVATAEGIGTIVSRVASVVLAEPPPLTPGPRSVLSSSGGPALLPCGLGSAGRASARVLAAPTPERRVYGSNNLHRAPPLLYLNVSWYKNEQPLAMESGRMSITPSGALEIDPLRPHDAAKYRCIVSTDAKQNKGEDIELRVSTETSTVEYAPRFIATPRPMTVIEGASVTFDCAAVGNPKPEITWLNNGVAIDLSDLDSRFYLVGGSSLRIQSARGLDAGAYTCRAHNRVDAADVTTQLDVQTFPRVQLPDGPVLVAHPGSDARLRCEARGRPAPAVAWLKDGELLTPNDHDMAIVDGGSLRIQGVLRVDAGMFQCVAHSAATGGAGAALRLVVATPHSELANVSTTKVNKHLAKKKINPKTFLNSLAASPEAREIKKSPKTRTKQDVFDSLISSEEESVPTPEDLDLVGEPSPASTPRPARHSDYETDEDDDPKALDYLDDLHEDDTNLDHGSFHAFEGLDLEELKKGNASAVSAPEGLKAVIVKHRFVTLSWDEPQHKLEDVRGYAVIYKVKGSERERVSRTSHRHSLNIASLQANTTYEFAVVAFTDHAVSPPTQEIEVTTLEEAPSSASPVEITAEATGPHTARISWRGQPGTSYTVTYAEVDSGREQVQQVATESAAAVATLSGLRAASAYWVRVASGGGGLESAPAAFRTPTDLPAAPPGNVTATPATATSILVRWESPPGRTHRGALTGYKIRYRAVAGAGGGSASPGRRKAETLTTPADVRRAEVTGLEAGTAYQIRLCAMNVNGSGPFGEWVTASTLQQTQAEEISVPKQPPALSTRAGRNWISVWWAASAASALSGYSLGWGLGVPDENSRELPAQAHSSMLRGLEPNSEYVISLRGSNSLGLGPPVYATVRTRPALDGAVLGDDEDDDEVVADDEDEDEDEDEPPPLLPPVGLKAIMLSGSTAVVYWTDPTLPKGQPVTDGRRYVVRWSSAGGKTKHFNASDLNCMIDDLRPFTLYEFAVKLIKGGRESPWSMLASNTSLEAPPASPPRELRASGATARAIELTWSPPAKPNGLIAGYVIMYAVQPRSGQAGDEEWTAVAVLGVNTRTRVDRLRSATTYLFKVQARNGKGLGPFCQPVSCTTGVEDGSGGLAAATSAWLWASAGGALAVLALAGALALSLCCRRPQPHSSTYQKSSASAAIKPPDLWIHHDQMELKHMEKSIHSSASKSNLSAGSVDGPNALVSSSLTLRGAAEYEPARRLQPPASLDRRHYVPTYVGQGPPSCGGGSDDTAILRSSPASIQSSVCRRCDNMDYSMGGVGVGAGCAATCERRPVRRPCDQSLMGGGLVSPQSSMASLGPHLAPPPAPCGSGTCPLGSACSSGAAGGVRDSIPLREDVYATAARERGHYVQYDPPMATYAHRDSLSSEAGAGSVGGSNCNTLQHRGLHSFALDHTPTHKGSIRETSPYKKSANSSPGHIPNRLQLGGPVAHCSEELELLTPSHSTERLNKEMQNLEGLMKDLSAITQQQFHC